jgi:hypothetical protein
MESPLANSVTSAEPDKFFGQIGNDPLGAAIKARRNTLDKGGYLCDFHNDLVIS